MPTTTFLHMADVHLGYQQYQSEERLKDFHRAFRQATDDAIAKKVDFVLIAGDLFHKASINPITLLQAKRPLDQLRQANIPTFAIKGNHDGARYGSQFSWLHYLEADSCLTMLDPFSPNGFELTPVNGTRGGYIDIKGIRIIGLPYIGASTEPHLLDLPTALQQLPQDNIGFTVLMGHFGLEGEVPGLNGAISHNIIAPLRKHVNYLALGHVHKPIERDGWVYNPGSLEACGMDEREWRGGWYHVTVDTNSGTHEVKHIKSKRRPLHRIKIEVDKFKDPPALYDAVRIELEAHRPALALEPMKPVVEIWLDGILAFDRHDLDTGYVEQILIEVIDPLKARVRNNTRATEFEIAPDEYLDRAELEQHVFTDLIIRDSRYRDQAETWAKLMREVKVMSLADNSPEAIVEAISRRMSLLDAETKNGVDSELVSKLAELKDKLEAKNVD